MIILFQKACTRHSTHFSNPKGSGAQENYFIVGQLPKVGIAALKDCGGPIIAQDETSSVVYGMPRAVAHLADRICPLPEVAGAILSYI